MPIHQVSAFFMLKRMERMKPIMFVGTGSDVGKSVITAAFGRILLQDGFSPAPFKAQNMSLNSYVTKDGGEMGRAQVVQAEACKVQCHTDMNPVLLKPNTDKTAQVILNGKPIGNFSADRYFRGEGKEVLFPEVLSAFDRLAERFNPIVVEGAGSISELNLKNNDIVNMPIAVAKEASTFLIADIDKGGVFASVYGTIMLLDDEEKSRIKGVLINKFRGDISLFDEGRTILEKLIGVPVLGVIPAFKDIYIEEEDSVATSIQNQQIAVEGKVNIAVVLLRRMSNFTDFNRLEQDDRINLYYTHNAEEIESADIVILPGSKSTISDLLELRKRGIASAIKRAAENGKTLIGICGGYQMMGERISDPHLIEGSVEEVPGLGILPIETEIEEEKQTEQTLFSFKGLRACKGYEIHMGKTNLLQGANPLVIKENGDQEGCMISDNCWGSYMHGILDNPAIINDLLAPFEVEKQTKVDYETFKDQQYDLLAAHVRENVDMDLFYRLVR